MPGLYKNPVRRAAGWIVYVYAYRGGKLIAQTPPCPTKEAAKAALIPLAPEIARRYAEERSGVDQRTFAAVIRAYRKSPEFGALALRTRQEYHRWLDQMEQHLGTLTCAHMGGRVGAQAARLWRDKLAEASVRNADSAMVTLAACCSWGRAAYMLAKDARPTEHIEKLYAAPLQEAWTDDEIQSAMTKLPPRLSDAVALALHTGLRRADLCKLPWTAIDEAAGVIRWTPAKSKRRRRVVVIPLTAGLRATLKRIPKRAVTVLSYVKGVGEKAKARAWTPSGLGHALDDALTEIGVTGRLHGLRRTAATRLASEGLSSRQIARQLGWSESEAEAMAAVYVNDERAVR